MLTLSSKNVKLPSKYSLTIKGSSSKLKLQTKGTLNQKYLHVVETGVYIFLDTAYFIFEAKNNNNCGTGNWVFARTFTLDHPPEHMCEAFKIYIYIPAPLRGGGVSFVGLSLLFEYTVVQRGWSRIASDVFRPVSRAQRDAEVVFGGNAHHPGLDLTFEWYHRANRAFSPPHANTEERALLATDNMDLHILDHRLRVTSISKNGLVNFTHPLIKLLFLRNRTR